MLWVNFCEIFESSLGTGNIQLYYVVIWNPLWWKRKSQCGLQPTTNASQVQTNQHGEKMFSDVIGSIRTASAKCLKKHKLSIVVFLYTEIYLNNGIVLALAWVCSHRVLYAYVRIYVFGCCKHCGWWNSLTSNKYRFYWVHIKSDRYSVSSFSRNFEASK